MTRIIYLHLGLSKTGTTTIQAVLFRERKSLLRVGILYPGFAENHSVPLQSIMTAEPHNISFNIAHGLGSLEAVTPRVNQWSRALDEALADESWNRMVLSAEGVINLSARELAGLRARLAHHADTVVVPICLRHPYDFRVSVIQQRIKGGVTIDETIRRMALPRFYRRTVGRIRDVFGAENLRFGIFEEMILHPDGLAEAFAAMIGLEPGLLPAERIGHRNRRMSLRAGLVLDGLNREVPLYHNGHVNPRRSLRANRLVMRLRGDPFSLTSEQAELLRAAVEDDRVFADELFGRQVWAEGVPAVIAPPARVRWVGAITQVAKLAGRVMS